MSNVGSVLVNVVLDSLPKGGWGGGGGGRRGGSDGLRTSLTIGTPALATPSVNQSSGGRACTLL